MPSLDSSQTQQDMQAPLQNSRQPQSPRQTFLFAVVAFILLRSLGGAAYHGAMNTCDLFGGGDFACNRDAAIRLRAGEGLFALDKGYASGPLVAFLLRPFAEKPLLTVFAGWTIASIVCIAISVAIFCAAARIGWSTGYGAILMLLIALRFWPTTVALSLGQTVPVLLLLLAAAFYADSRRSPLGVAVLIALAAMFKVWVLGLLLYLLLRRQWKAALRGGIAFFAMTFVSFLPLGWNEFLAYRRIVSAYASQPGCIDQCFAGFARVHFAPNPHVAPLINSHAIALAFTAAGFVLVGAGLLAAFRRPPSPDESPYMARLRFGLVASSLLLTLPLSHNHYLMLILPLLWTLIATSDPDRPATRTIIPIAAFGIYLLLTLRWPSWGKIPPQYYTAAPSLSPSPASSPPPCSSGSSPPRRSSSPAGLNFLQRRLSLQASGQNRTR